MILLNPWKTSMKYYAHLTDVETEALRNFDFMLLLGALFFIIYFYSVPYYPHILLIHFSLKFHKLSLCLFLLQWVSLITLIKPSKIAKERIQNLRGNARGQQ